MTLNDVKAMTEKARLGFLATTDGSRAEVRPVGGFAWFGTELWIASFRKTNKVADVGKHPAVELCFMPGDWLHVRIAGQCTISGSPDDKQLIYDSVSILSQIFSGADDPNLAVLRVRPERIRVMENGKTSYTEIPIDSGD